MVAVVRHVRSSCRWLAVAALAFAACAGGEPAMQHHPASHGGASGGAFPTSGAGGAAGASGAAGIAAPEGGTSGTGDPPSAGTGGSGAPDGMSGAGGESGGPAGAAGGEAGQGGAGGDGASGTGGGGGDAAPTGPTLPPIDDPAAAGPFRVERVTTASGLSTHSLFVPSETGTHGKHPAVVWTCGNGGTVSFYQSFLEHLASHGFLVLADKASSGTDRQAEVESQLAAISWLRAENERQGGELFGKIDVDNIAVMGHSLGSLASFATAAQSEHVATSVHYSGGLTGNPVGFDERWLADMTRPAAFLCGGADGTAGPSCEQDFEMAPAALPVFYGVLAGASHIGPFAATPRAGEYGRAGVAWLRWQLADDPAFASWFVGPNCTLCTSPWTAKQRNL